jgi:hypothetical protein
MELTTMRDTSHPAENADPMFEAYEAPELNVVGKARDIVLGVPGSGLDGPIGYSDPVFEFEWDED